ncbi:spore germination protein GerPC [Staphylospora marina]|uniref:spore germination protein GerPC n=1 Tax=Staphylospora marina TaxID=2490858 RepID=UPI0013DE66F8|nr:spore germination protein GerPC [Staphylospora marina]
MYGSGSWESLWYRLYELEKQVRKLAEENKELKEKLENLKPVQIDKVEYKIHDLSIDTLSGTLNVGLTANTDDPALGETIGKWIEKGGTNIMTDESAAEDGQDRED